MLRRTNLTKIEHRSLIVFGVPRELRHEVDLAAFFDSLGIGPVETVVICRKWIKLREAVKKRAEALDRLERIYYHIQMSSGDRLAQWLQPSSSGTDRGRGGDSVSSSEQESLLGSGDNRTIFRNSISASEEDPSLAEIISYLDAVNPRKRPTHRVLASRADAWDDTYASHTPWWKVPYTASKKLFEKRITVDSASFWAARYKFWDARVSALRKSPEHSPSTAVAFITFESPQSAVC